MYEIIIRNNRFICEEYIVSNISDNKKRGDVKIIINDNSTIKFCYVDLEDVKIEKNKEKEYINILGGVKNEHIR